MKPSELAKFRYSGKWPPPELPSPVELEGKLIASGDFSHLIDLDTPDFSPVPCFGVLLPRGLIDRLDHLQIPLLCGSFVNFVGYSTFICEVWQTGYHMLPYQMTQVYSFTYEDEYVGKHSFHVSDMAYDIYIHATQNLDAGALKALLPCFERKFTIMELRKHLNTDEQTLLHRSLEGKRLSDVEKILKELKLSYQLRRVPKRNDWIQQYPDDIQT